MLADASLQFSIIRRLTQVNEEGHSTAAVRPWRRVSKHRDVLVHGKLSLYRELSDTRPILNV